MRKPKESTDKAPVDYSNIDEKRKAKEIPPYDSLHNGEIQLSRKTLFEGDNLEGEVKLYFEEEDYTDPELNQMKTDLVFTLLCDTAATFQALRHFSEARKCLDEASEIGKNECHLLLLKSLNVYLDKSAHTTDKLLEALEIAGQAVGMLNAERSEASAKLDPSQTSDVTDTTEDFAYKLVEDIKGAYRAMVQKNRAIILPAITQSMLDLKNAIKQRKGTDNEPRYVRSLDSLQSSIQKSESKPKLDIDRVFKMTKMSAN